MSWICRRYRKSVNGRRRGPKEHAGVITGAPVLIARGRRKRKRILWSEEILAPTDAQAELKYNFIDSALVDAGAKLGYRILDIQLEQDSSRETKLKFKGPYIGLEAHF